MIAELVDMMLLAVRGSSVSEIEQHADGHRLRLVRDLGQQEIVAETPQAAAPAIAEADPVENERKEIVRAGMHGTFYRASAPDQPPLVELGQRVEAGQQLALIESMKMLHAVETDHAGRVAEVLASSGAPVEPGAPLFVIDAGESRDV
ncbi:acetyl-CoA carboxylase biotin carboxyl carrier protein [Variovorax defluvii]|uniref:Biotin carboxyl carrier protein of acetyl-CoA carboxylase n=1 Tax=Variovorax defluvii TaxID=913761 RepID=A0ABP8H5D3_9BURK